MCTRLAILTAACLFLAAPVAAEEDLPETSRFFEEYDRNADGVVTADEFDGSGEVFRLLDKDKDGKIQATELGLPADFRPDPNAKKRREQQGKRGDRAGNNRKRLERFQKLFQQWDVNGDGAVTKAEWRGNENAFDRFDRNKDGKIDKTDVPGLFPDEMMGGEMMGGPDGAGDAPADGSASGEAKPNKQPRKTKGGRAGWAERLRRMDANGDGVLTRDEWKGRDQGFDRLDRDGDGKIPLDELGAKDQGAAAHPKITPEQVQKRFGQLDTDKDGALTVADGLPAATIEKMDADKSGGVDADEFQAAVLRAQTKQPGAGKTDKANKAGKPRKGNAKLIKRFDRDRDGRVSRDEFPMSDERFDSMDRDGDGYLTKADFEEPAADAGDAKPAAPEGDAGK